ncbi:MAG: AAA family ATPase [Solirubrobacterales bacterium]
MDTIEMLGYKKLETLYENPRVFICRGQNNRGETFLLKGMKDDQPSAELLEQFEYEYKLLSGLHIQGIVRGLELVNDYKGHMVVMDDNGGIPLAYAPIFKSIRHGDRKLDLRKFQLILGIFTEMVKVIGTLHDHNLILKEVTPANFLLLPSSMQVRILNLGMASCVDNLGSQLYEARSTEGELWYISPEQTGRMNKEVDYRTDFYSLGISMYELITGKKPFDTQDSLELIYCHIALTPEPPHMVNSDIPEMVSAIIMKLMEKEPEQRYQSAGGIVHDLEKCLDGLKTSVDVEVFDIGMEDVSSKFEISQKIYGREAEREKLEQLYHQVMTGTKRFLLVQGEAGLGKTALVQKIYQPLAESVGYFAGGKGEQFQKNTPYFVFGKIVKELVETLLKQPDSQLKHYKENLIKALNGNGRLLTDLVSELEAVIDQQPPVNELGPAENRNRLLYTFSSFLKVFAQRNHPLTLFLDDLQWCDQLSVELINYLLFCDDMENLLLIGCYRDNELIEGNHLYSLFKDLLKSDKTVTLQIKQLSEENIAQMLADTMQQSEERVLTLSKIVQKKTQGNPFFIRKLMLHLYDRQLIRFNGERKQWEWDNDKIDSVGVGENIVDFLISEITKLPLEIQDIVRFAALIGSSFHVKTLSAVMDISVQETTSRLQEAFYREIIVSDNRDNSIAEVLNKEELNMNFRFAHDRIQQACAALTEAQCQRKLHLQIGRIMKMNTPCEELHNQAMEIVSHLNEGLEWVITSEERWEIVRLNLWACEKAKRSSAFYSALQYIAWGVRALPDNAWAQDYGFTFAIIKTYAECAYLNNDYNLAEEQAKLLLLQARTYMEQCEIRLMQSTLYNFQGRLDKAIEYAFLGLKLLKIKVPVNPGMPLLMKEMIVVKVAMIGKNKEDLLNLSPMKNEKIKMVLHLLNEINRAAYLYGNTNLFLLSILKRMQLTLKYGNYHEAGTTYVAYAMILAILGDFKGTYEFCELALKSHEKEKSFECRPTTLFSCGFFGHAWNRSWQDAEQWFQKAMEEAVKYGDHHTIALAGSFMYAFKPDASIRLLVKKAMKQYTLVKQTNNRLSINLTFVMIHRWLNYAGFTDERFTMSVSQETFEKNGGIGIIYTEEECMDALRQGNFLSAIGVYYKEKMYIHYLYEDYTGALSYLKESDKYIKYHTGTPYIVECRMCSFLVLAANIQYMGKKEAGCARKRLKKEYSHMKSWAKHCPVNFQHLNYIMEAELARIHHKFHEAADLYDLAMQTARQNGFIRDEALANELAAKMFIALEKEKQASLFMTEALKIYRLWGADAKVSQITEKYRHLLREKEYNDKVFKTAAATEDMDIMSLVRASKAVSKENLLPNLLRLIIKTVIENSGAQKACILLKWEQEWRIEAERQPGSSETEVLQSIPLREREGLLPTSVINFCIRTGECLVLRDAANMGKFCKDPYVQQNQTKSLLCMPILNQGTKEGILYLENNLSADVFTKEHLNILQLLAVQFLISIKNFRLFTELLAKTEEVHQAAEEVLRSDIAFLQAQIKPHFLYNAINTISAFSLDDSQMARDLLAKLSQYLRSSFDFKNRDKLVTLSKELELVEAYLFIEKARFGHRLQVIYDIDYSVDCLLPPLIIQPLVENAVQHGLSNRKKGGTVRIAVHNEKDFVMITVEDDGEGIDEALLSKLFVESNFGSGGVALKNIQLRLIRLYGHGLELERKASGGTRATIRITK